MVFHPMMTSIGFCAFRSRVVPSQFHQLDEYGESGNCGRVIAIDGKVVRRSHDRGIGKTAIDMVSAWTTANHLVLG